MYFHRRDAIFCVSERNDRIIINAIFCVSGQNDMDDLFKNKYRVSSARMPGWDYGSHGLYYVTICTKNRINYFGDIVSNEDQNRLPLRQIHLSETQNIASLRATPIGEIASKNWLDIPNNFQFVELDDFVVMPNHLHGILFINKPNKTDWQVNKFGVQSQNLASAMRGYKASVKTFATTNDIEFAWQPRYHDHVIRNEREYINISEYIRRNPDEWLLNGDNEDDLYRK